MFSRSPGKDVSGRQRRARLWLQITTLVTVAVIGLAAFAATAAGQSILEPASRNAEKISDLWWLMFWMGAAVFVVVMLLLAFAVTIGRRGDRSHGLSNSRRQTVVIVGGIVVPFLILLVVFGSTQWTISGLADDSPDAELTVEVVAHQFWWEVRYPDDDVVTANEIHIPVGEPVQLRFTSGDVIHSFWIPELDRKVDVMPGTTTTMTINADAPGRYRGQCNQFCGVQHANMAVYVVADEPDDFEEWIDHQQQEAESPTGDSLVTRGRDIFIGSACIYCHTVRGTGVASGEVGPDLTHLGSRETIASGILENNAANLAGWVLDPQHLKPGNRMPGVDLTSEELQALLAYLLSLD